MTELVDGKLGNVAEYKVEIVDAKVVVSVAHADSYAEASIVLKLSPAPLVQMVADKIKALIPGKIDDAILDEAVSLLLEKLKSE